MPTLTVTAPGKVILCGEHAVVYGQPAVVAAADRFLQLRINFQPEQVDPTFFHNLLQNLAGRHVTDVMVDLNNYFVQDGVQLDSHIPVGCGMGSSAAMAVALVAAMCFFADYDQYRFETKSSVMPIKLDLEAINAAAFTLEQTAHHSASGIDNTVITYGGVMEYTRPQAGAPLIFPLLHNLSLNNFFLVNTGQPAENTAQMVQKVAEMHKLMSEKVETIMHSIGMLAKQWIAYLHQGNEANNLAKIQAIIRQNSELLFELGVVAPTVQEVITEINESGGAGKISGAGGYVRNSGILLVSHTNKSLLEKILSRHGLTALPMSISPQGLTLSINTN